MSEDDALIEAMAKAICASDGAIPDDRVMSAPSVRVFTADRECDNSEDLGAEWEQWASHARAALTAYRNFQEVF